MSALPRSAVERLVAVEVRQADDREELQRVRKKVHELIGSLAAVAGLVREIANVHEELSVLRVQIPEVARRSAEEAIDVALERRDEIARASARERRAGLGIRTQVFACLIGLAGFLTALITLLVSNHLP